MFVHSDWDLTSTVEKEKKVLLFIEELEGGRRAGKCVMYLCCNETIMGRAF